jgi:hypothetical protein
MKFVVFTPAMSTASGAKRIKNCFVGAGTPYPGLRAFVVKTGWDLTSNPSFPEDTDGKCERFFLSVYRCRDVRDRRRDEHGANSSIATALFCSTWNTRENPCDFR